MEYLPNYDELWAISDIHMGGTRTATQNFQIFNKGQRLGNFIRKLKDDQPGKDVALVLNGDIIDSLAEEKRESGYVALNLETAIGMMNRIYDDPEFKPVWSALADFVRTKNRHLVMVIGNHDIELALTAVQASLRERLAGGNAAAQARIVFSTYGGGFACRVAGKRVFCTHGNEVDDWNIVDYSDIGNLDNAINAGRRPDPNKWFPNAGTRMVIDIMNKVKKRFPFVDLLKPETNPVLSILLSLDPSMVAAVDLGAGYKVLREKISGADEVKGLLSAGAPLENISQPAVAAAIVNNVLGENLSGLLQGSQPGTSEDDLLIDAEPAVVKANGGGAGKVEGATLGLTDTIASLRGWSDIVSGMIGWVDRDEALRHALMDWLANDDTYNPGAQDDCFTGITPRVGTDVDFIVTGHTHLAREIPMGGSRTYFNCGTWIRLLRLTRETLETKTQFKTVYDALAAGSMDKLDETQIPGPNGPEDLVYDRANTVHIWNSGAQLLRVKDTPDKKDVILEPEVGGGL